MFMVIALTLILPVHLKHADMIAFISVLVALMTKKKIGSKFSEQISDGRPMIMKKPVFY